MITSLESGHHEPVCLESPKSYHLLSSHPNHTIFIRIKSRNLLRLSSHQNQTTRLSSHQNHLCMSRVTKPYHLNISWISKPNLTNVSRATKPDYTNISRVSKPYHLSFWFSLVLSSCASRVSSSGTYYMRGIAESTHRSPIKDMRFGLVWYELERRQFNHKSAIPRM